MSDLEPRVQQLENNHTLLVQELRHQTATLEKIQQSIEKQNETLTRYFVLEERINTNSKRLNKIEKDIDDVNEDMKDGFKDVYDEIKKNYEKGLEAQNRNLWMIIVTFVGGVLGFIYQLGGK